MSNYKTTKAACYSGFVVQAVVNNFLPLLFIVFQDRYGIGYERLGRLILMNFAVQIFADIMTTKIVEKIGYRATAALCQGCAAAGLLLLAVLPSVIKDTYLAVTLSLVVYAFASGLMEVILSPLVEILPTGRKSANMAFLHSFYCWGQALTIVVTTFLIHLFGYGRWQFIPAVWAVIPLVNMLCFLKVPIIEPATDEVTTPLKNLLCSRKFICFMVLMICAGASEITMSEWASLFAQQGLGLSKVAGDLAGPFAFAIFMGTGRIVYSKFADRVSIRTVIAVMGTLCTVCYIVVGVCKIPIFALIACAACGFTVSVTWPGTYSAAAASFPRGGMWMFGVLALCGDSGCSLGPWLLGITAEVSNLNTGFIVSAIFPIIMVITALFFMNGNGRQSD